MGPKYEQARPGKLVGARTTLAPGVNGISELSAGTEEIKNYTFKSVINNVGKIL